MPASNGARSSASSGRMAGGKSTLLKAILGIVPIVQGSVTLFGRPSATMRSSHRLRPPTRGGRLGLPRHRVGCRDDGPLPACRVAPSPGRRRCHASWRRCCARWGCGSSRRTQIGQLSGGQQQRVFVARALAQAADVLLLDEPFNGIDAQTQEVIRTIIDSGRQAGKIVLLATHDLVSASCACDCLCCLNQRLVSYGPTQETYTAAIPGRNVRRSGHHAGAGGVCRDRGRRLTPAHPPHAPHHPVEHPHHRHIHEPLGREHE